VRLVLDTAIEITIQGVVKHKFVGINDRDKCFKLIMEQAKALNNNFRTESDKATSDNSFLSKEFEPKLKTKFNISEKLLRGKLTGYH
jgi:hypothetical protein